MVFRENYYADYSLGYMLRRSFLATTFTAISAGCIGGNLASPTPTATQDLPIQTENLLEISTVANYWLSSVRYLDTQTNSLKELSPEEGGFLQVNLKLRNLGDKAVWPPRYGNFAVQVGGETYESKLTLPEGVSFSQLRQQDDQLKIQEPNPDLGRELRAGGTYYLNLLFTAPDPGDSCLVRWSPREEIEITPSPVKFWVSLVH